MGWVISESTLSPTYVDEPRDYGWCETCQRHQPLDVDEQGRDVCALCAMPVKIGFDCPHGGTCENEDVCDFRDVEEEETP